MKNIFLIFAVVAILSTFCTQGIEARPEPGPVARATPDLEAFLAVFANVLPLLYLELYLEGYINL